MGIFDSIRVEEGVDLPHFPENIDQTEVGWQSKSLACCMYKYKLSEEGRLLRKQKSYRERTDEEKQEESRQASYTKDQVVDEVWWADQNQHGSFEFYSSLRRDPQDEVPLRKDPNGQKLRDDDGEVVTKPTDYALDLFICYEARFTKGDLDEIILVPRTDEQNVEEIIEELNEWSQ